MTHGDYGISHGSVGGARGGGFSSDTSRASTSSRPRRQNSGSNDSDYTWWCILMPFILLIYAVRYGLAYLLCLVDMKLGVRIAITWVYVLVIAFLGGILTWTANSWIVTIPASLSDEITISPTSTAFCQSLTITTDVDEQIDFYALTKPLQIDTNNIVNFSTNTQACITPASYEYLGFYLLEGSYVSLSFHADRLSAPLYFYAIKGEDNFNTWTDDMDCQECYIGKSWFYSDSYTLTVTETNQYYFAFGVQQVYDDPCSGFSASFYIERTRYKRTNAEKLCSNSYKCTVNFPIFGSRVVVVDILPESVHFHSKLDVVCSTRLYMYIIVFGMCPSLAGGIVTYILCRIKKRKQVSVNTASNDRPYVATTTDERQAIMARVQSYVKNLRPVPPPDGLEEIN